MWGRERPLYTHLQEANVSQTVEDKFPSPLDTIKLLQPPGPDICVPSFKCIVSKHFLEITQPVNERTPFRALFSQLNLWLLRVWFYCLLVVFLFVFSHSASPSEETVVPLVSSIKGKIPARQFSVQCLPIQNVNSSGIHSAPDCPVPQCASTFSPCFLLLYAHREVSVSHLPVRHAAQRLHLRLCLSAGVRHRAPAPSLPELK